LELELAQNGSKPALQPGFDLSVMLLATRAASLKSEVIKIQNIMANTPGFAYTTLAKKRYINTLPFLFLFKT